VFADDTPFADPAQLLIDPDHYVFRTLASQGIEPARLGVPRLDGGPVETDSRKSGVRSARTGGSSAARPRGTGWTTSLSRFSGSTWCPALRQPTQSMTRSPLA
jgi:glucuronate isomerase